jgi:hypothetical protein
MALLSAAQGRQFEHCIEEFPRAEADRVVGRQAGLGLGLGNRGARRVLGDARAVEGDRRDLRGSQA